MKKSSLIAVGYEKLLNLTSAEAPEAARRALVQEMRDCGLALPVPDIGATLDAYAGTLARPGAILIGSIAFETYCGMRGLIDVAPELVSTRDVDIACQLRGLRETAPPRRTTANDFIRDPGDGAVKVDFVTPETLREEEYRCAAHWVYAPTLASYAHIIPGFTRLMLRDPIDAVIAYGAGIPVCVPDPLRFAMRKLQLAAVRHDPSKAAKDLGQAALLLNEFCPERLGDAVIAREFFAYGKGMLQPDLCDGIAQMAPHLSRSAVDWLTAGFAQTRPGI